LYPGLSVGGGTPTKGAIAQADASLTTTWNGDPKKKCDRAYGVILCTDGQSNIGNPGNLVWDATIPGCASDTAGTAFINFPPFAAEAMYLDAHQDMTSAGNAIIRARTFAIGLSTDISRCELNRIAYRGRTDANAPNKDAGFTLYSPAPAPCDLSTGDSRLPWIDPCPATAGTANPTDESGASLPASSGGKNRFDPDQTPLPATANQDYAFFASDAQTLEDSFLAIVNSSASGDYTTSSPVSGGAVALGNTVILPSTRFPSWQGHLRALDTTNPASIVPLWDAGEVLTNPPQVYQPRPATRSLYTWDPSHSNALIAITTANAGLIDGLCGSCGITSAVVDFIRGNNGKELNQKRKWLLGPAINSTPAIVGPPQIYYQTGNVAPHKSFETLYTARRALAWVGADDGLVHAFDLADGSEVIGLLPPNLIKNQTKLYANYLAVDSSGRKTKTETGQEPETADHIWGVANSFRFADIWFPGPKIYKTVGFVTTGPGGDLVAAIDITHPYGNLLGTPAVPGPGAVPADKNFDPLKPVEILWTKGSSDYPGLNLSWSVPAIAANTNTTSLMTFGAGINPNSLYNNGQKDANVFVVDPRDGTLISSPPVAIAPLASPDPLVGHQTFAHSVFFQTSARGFQPDNIANLSIQVDTNGRANALWADGSHPWSAPKSATLIDLNAAAGDLPQPIYYSPAANGIGTQGCQVYALVSGSLYERSPAVSGWNVNRDAPTVKPPAGSGFPDTLPAFVPNLFIATNPYKITDFPFATTPLGATAPTDMSSYVIKKQIGGETAGIPLQLTDPTYSDGSGPDPVHTRLGIHTQVTSSPLLIIDQSTDVHEALFSVYDPDYGCNGYSYIIIVKFKLASECAVPPAFDTTTVYAAGPGAASGFVVTKDSLFAAKSGVKKNDASLFKVDVPPAALPGAPNFVPVWWKEQK
jgi:prepilin-type processing-associated H-X9-DG protein